jgi:hypothetical protein
MDCEKPAAAMSNPAATARSRDTDRIEADPEIMLHPFPALEVQEDLHARP